MHIRMLGPLDLRDDAGRAIEIGGARLRALLIRLALDAGRPVSADRLVDDLWEGDPPAAAGNALQALVSRLRGVVGRALVESGPGGYRLALDPGRIDAVVFERLVRTGRTALADDDPMRAADVLRQALELWRGPALADVADAEFAAATVVRLDGLRIAAVEDRIEADLRSGPAASPVPELEELTTVHPLRERLRGQLMRALYDAGRQADALAVYEDTRRDLADRLGIDPSPELAAVHLAILRQDPGSEHGVQAAGRPRPAAEPAPDPERDPVRAVSPSPGMGGGTGPATDVPAGGGPGDTIRDTGRGPSPRVRSPRSTNLPARLTSFVGREEEIERADKLLCDSRLVTLTGPGGVGKTRLATEAAARFGDRAVDGVWFVPLASVRDALDLPQAVLVALGIVTPVDLGEPKEVAPPLDRLVDALMARRMVLVLDNCEHLVDAVARLADAVLAAAPEVRILATSREPLGITGEVLCPVPSLTLPPEDATAEEAMGYAVVRLFEDRAAAVRPGFTVDAGTVAPTVRICRALDGIPLAVELAAARLHALTPPQVADRLDDRFRLLTSGSRAALPRHQTLRAIVDWSWDLLSAPERAVLRRLSVFSGGATPDAAERVCAIGAGDDPSAVIDLVASLVDKSLVVATGTAEVRYRLLETVRAYAGERLAEEGEEDAARTAHAAYFLELAERAEPELRGHDQLIWADRLAAEHDNCIAGLRYAIEGRDVERAVRFIGALVWYWILRDYEVEAGEWASSVWEIAGAGPPPSGAEDAYVLCAFTAAVVHEMTQADGPRADALGEAVRTATSHLAESSAHPALALLRPLVALFSGDQAAVRRELWAAAGHPHPWARAAAHTFMGLLMLTYGEVVEAGAELEQGYEGFRSVGDRWGMTFSLVGRSELALACDAADQAVRFCEEACRYITDGISPDQSAMLRIQLGRARMVGGDLEAARADLEVGVAAAERKGDYGDAAQGYVWLSDRARRLGDLEQARVLAGKALAMLEPRKSRRDLASSRTLTYSRLGCLAELAGDLTAAADWHAKAVSAIGELALLPVNGMLAGVLEGMAALAAARGRPVRAAELLGAAYSLRGFSDPASLEVPRTTEAVITAIGRAEFDAAHERGGRLTRDEMFALTPDR